MPDSDIHSATFTLNMPAGGAVCPAPGDDLSSALCVGSSMEIVEAVTTGKESKERVEKINSRNQGAFSCLLHITIFFLQFQR